MATWVRMVNLAMNQRFGNPDGNGGFHPGCDYAGPSGLTVVSPSDGVVLQAGQSWDGGFGYHPVAIYHPADGVTTLAGHMEAHYVNTGATVTAGQPIGALGSQGRSTGPHLHAELRKGQRAYGGYGDGATMDLDGWYYAVGAYAKAPMYMSVSPLTQADRMKIGAMQSYIGVKVDMAWGPATDLKLRQIRDYYFGHADRTNATIAKLQHLWGVAPESGKWLDLTDKAYQLWRYCLLNK